MSILGSLFVLDVDLRRIFDAVGEYYPWIPAIAALPYAAGLVIEMFLVPVYLSIGGWLRTRSGIGPIAPFEGRLSPNALLEYNRLPPSVRDSLGGSQPDYEYVLHVIKSRAATSEGYAFERKRIGRVYLALTLVVTLLVVVMTWTGKSAEALAATQRQDVERLSTEYAATLNDIERMASTLYESTGDNRRTRIDLALDVSNNIRTGSVPSRERLLQARQQVLDVLGREAAGTDQARALQRIAAGLLKLHNEVAPPPNLRAPFIGFIAILLLLSLAPPMSKELTHRVSVLIEHLPNKASTAPKS